MSRQEVDKFFNEYVFGFIYPDIQREIELARSSTPGGNLLAALGLLCYTEFMGGISRGSFTAGSPRKRFNKFFREMGQPYADALGRIDVYEIFRCGLVHEYLVKGRCQIAMLKGLEPCGLGKLPNGQYYFVVETYFEDFKTACQAVYNRLMAESNPAIPSGMVKGQKPQRWSLLRFTRQIWRRLTSKL